MALRTHRLFHLVCEFDVCAALREADGLHVVHTAHAQPAFHDVSRQAEIVLPIGHQRYAAEMSSRGMIPTPFDYVLERRHGHQWNSVLSRIVSGCWIRARQRLAIARSRLPMVSKQQLASGSSTKVQRCSAGCSSG